MYCRKCGSKIPDDSVFCMKCGEKVLIEETPVEYPTAGEAPTTETVVEGVPVEELPTTPAPSEPSEVVASNTVTTINDGSTAEHHTADDTKPKSKKSRIVVTAFCAVLIGVIIFFATNGKCGTQGCINKTAAGKNHCEEHLCPVTSCQNSKATQQLYCIEHTCSVDGCIFRALDGLYCASHQCAKAYCSNKVRSGSLYCVSHGCAASGCANEKTDGDYCYDHVHKGNTREMLTNPYFSFKLNSAGGIVFNFGATNSTGKTIKYVRFKVYLYNAVDDPVKDEIKRTYSVDVEIIGPVDKYKRVELDNKIIGYCEDCAKIVIKDITIIFTDGTSEIVSFNYYYEK